MTGRLRLGALLLGTPVLSSIAAAAPLLSAHLATRDTLLVLEADAQAPRLRRLSQPGGGIWRNDAVEAPPAEIELGGERRSLQWQLDAAASRIDDRQVEFVYRSQAPRLTWRWRWRAPLAQGPIEHSAQLENEGPRELWLSLQPSLSFAWRIPAAAGLQRFWVEKGADTPGPVGTHLEPLGPGARWEGRSSTYARPVAGREREMIPFVLVQQIGGTQAGWYVGIEFSGRTHLTLRRAGGTLSGEAGLDPDPGPYRTRVPVSGTFATPTVFLGAAHGGPDITANALRRWVRDTLNRRSTLADPLYPLLVSNSWGAGTAVDEALARRMIEGAAGLGLEMFHLDAGWFRDVGDWEADPRKFPHGLASLAAFAHQRGLRFGLWMDWTQAGTSTRPGARSVHDAATRDWLIADPPPGWQHTEPFKGITFDLGVPAARAWAQGELERLIGALHLDMLEHDGYLVAQGSVRSGHPAAPPDAGSVRVFEDSGFLWVEGSNATDVSDHATRAYYAIHDALRAQHPQLLLEVCNDGGRMVDFGSAAHGDYFSL
ncbi:MAG: alpha-galactosidase, partial [Gammaproteobacteria bacterium]|nr:alpha-galactosidase [Gammaproteobacteria bacterium]